MLSLQRTSFRNSVVPSSDYISQFSTLHAGKKEASIHTYDDLEAGGHDLGHRKPDVGPSVLRGQGPEADDDAAGHGEQDRRPGILHCNSQSTVSKNICTPNTRFSWLDNNKVIIADLGPGELGEEIGRVRGVGADLAEGEADEDGGEEVGEGEVEERVLRQPAPPLQHRQHHRPRA